MTKFLRFDYTQYESNGGFNDLTGTYDNIDTALSVNTFQEDCHIMCLVYEHGKSFFIYKCYEYVTHGDSKVRLPPRGAWGHLKIFWDKDGKEYKTLEEWKEATK